MIMDRCQRVPQLPILADRRHECNYSLQQNIIIRCDRLPIFTLSVIFQGLISLDSFYNSIPNKPHSFANNLPNPRGECAFSSMIQILTSSSASSSSSQTESHFFRSHLYSILDILFNISCFFLSIFNTTGENLFIHS